MKTQKYLISVAEPWDFESQDGENKINGNILNVLNGKYIIFKSKHTLNFGNTTGDILILTPRYEKSDISDLYGGSMTINGNILKIEFNKMANIQELLDNSDFVISGNIQIAV